MEALAMLAIRRDFPGQQSTDRMKETYRTQAM